MIRRLLDVAPDEFHIPKVPDARVGPGVHEPHSVEIHPDDSGPEPGQDEGESPFPGPNVQHASSAKILVAELIEEHWTQRIGIGGCLTPWDLAGQPHDVNQGSSSGRIGRTK